MKFLLLACLIAVATASDVVELTDADFDTDIQRYDVALVEFFAPWCGHCKKLAPEYEKAATTLKNEDPPVTLVKVDCIANSEVCGKFGVSGYPTLKIFRGGEKSADYNGPRQADGIVSYMKKQASPASKDLADAEAFDKYLGKRMEPVAIGFFSGADDDDAKIWAKLTGDLREEYTFAHTYNKDVAEREGYSGEVVLYRPKHLANKFEESKVKMTDSISKSNVKNFMDANFLGLCGLLTRDNEGKFKKPLLTVFYNVDYVRNVKGTNYWRNRVMKYGKDKGVTLSIANADDFGDILDAVGLKFNGEKPVAVIRDEDDKKYAMTDEFTADGKALEAFLKAYSAGELTPKIKSEPVPESQDGPVTVVVGETFDDIVMDENKDVLIEFYAPWCGHCKNLAPKWDELGEKMKPHEDLVIAKIDATANEYSSKFQVSGFPTIYFSPKGKKDSPMKYNGGREVDDFVSYLEKHATTMQQKEEL